MKINGRNRVVIPEDTLMRFVAKHQDEIVRGQNFRQMSDDEREGVILGAQELASQGYGLTILSGPTGHPFNAFKGQLDELRISNVVRDYVVPEPSMMLLAIGALAFFRKK